MLSSLTAGFTTTGSAAFAAAGTAALTTGAEALPGRAAPSGTIDSTLTLAVPVLA